MSSTPIRFSRSEKILLGLMAAIQFSHIVDFMIVMPLGPQLMRLFEITPKAFGLLVSSYTFSASISGLLASLFVDRFDRKRSLVFFFVGFAVSTLACAWAPSYFTLLAARSFAGAFGGVLGSLVFAIVSDTISYERRGSAMGIVMGAFSVASVAGVPFSLYLANRFSWHAPFIFLSLLSVPTLFLILKYVPSVRGHLQQDAPSRPPLESLIHLIRSSNQLRALLFMFCLVIGHFSIIPFLSPSFVFNAGLAEAQLPLIYLFGGICSMISSPTAGRLADKYGKHRVFSVSILLSLVSIATITQLKPSPAWWILTVSCSFFIVMSGRMVPAVAMVSSTATPAYRGSFMSIVSAVQNMGAAMASWVAGVIVTSGADGRMENYGWVGAMAIMFSLLALLLSRTIVTGES